MIPLAKVTIVLGRTADGRYNTIALSTPEGAPIMLELVADAVVVEDKRNVDRPTALTERRLASEAKRP